MTQRAERENHDFELFAAVLLYFLVNIECLAVIGPLGLPPFEVLQFLSFVAPPVFFLVVLCAQLNNFPGRWSWWAILGVLAAMPGAAWLNFQCLFQALAAV